MNILTNNTERRYKNRSADERQAELYKKFPQDSFLAKQSNMDNFMLWVTFFRRNLNRFATDYLGLKLHWYQEILLYMMGICNFIVVIASRASAKSFMIALFACCKAILYPNSKIILSSSTKAQSKLLVSEKIEKELRVWSKALDKEIVKIKDNQNEVIVYFRNHSTIKVVPASDNARGNRSTCLVREECRKILKNIDDSVLSPMQFLRNPPYLKDPYYGANKDLQEEAIDVYISSSWFDNGSDDTWMWKIVDNTYQSMLNFEPAVVMAFDESIALCHNIKSQKALQNERRKQDSITWKLEFLNYRLKENTSAFFTYGMLQKNQINKSVFYPRTTIDYKSGKKNPYFIPKLNGEIRVVSCDLSFVQGDKNDNSVFTCYRAVPEKVSKHTDDGEYVIDNGYRRMISYIQSMNGGEIRKQALAIERLYFDFDADYIVLDLRNAGVSCFDLLARPLYDDERGIEYPPLTCMNDDAVANRIKVEGAEPRIFAVVASQKLNSDIALDLLRVLNEQKIEFLVNFETASEELLPSIKEYVGAEDGLTQSFYESPFLETQALFSETTSLLYEKRADTGVIVIREQGNNRKDRYSSASYGNYFISLLERDLVNKDNEYEYSVLIN